MILRFRRLDASNGFLASLEPDAGLEITVLWADGYRDHRRFAWDLGGELGPSLPPSVAYKREV